MNPPIVYEVTKPKTHNTNKTIAIVYSMSVLLFLMVIERHLPAPCLDATARCAAPHHAMAQSHWPVASGA
jgi:hypothetical protein